MHEANRTWLKRWGNVTVFLTLTTILLSWFGKGQYIVTIALLNSASFASFAIKVAKNPTIDADD